MRILMIGNSFSDDTIEYSHQIAKSLNCIDFECYNMYIGNCSIDMHLENIKNDNHIYEFRHFELDHLETSYNYSLYQALKYKKWDIITLQQSSPLSGIKESYQRLDELIHIISKYSKAKIYFIMTWAYDNDSTHPEFIRYDNNQTKMYEAILKANKDIILNNPKITKIIPIGSAIQNLRNSSLAKRITRDGYHLSFDVGRYLAGLTFINCLYHVDLNKAYKIDSIDEKQKHLCIDAACKAFSNPFNSPIFNLKFFVLGSINFMTSDVIEKMHQTNKFAYYKDARDYYTIENYYQVIESDFNDNYDVILLEINDNISLNDNINILIESIKSKSNKCKIFLVNYSNSIKNDKTINANIINIDKNDSLDSIILQIEKEISNN